MNVTILTHQDNPKWYTYSKVVFVGLVIVLVSVFIGLYTVENFLITESINMTVEQNDSEFTHEIHVSDFGNADSIILSDSNFDQEIETTGQYTVSGRYTIYGVINGEKYVIASGGYPDPNKSRGSSYF